MPPELLVLSTSNERQPGLHQLEYGLGLPKSLDIREYAGEIGGHRHPNACAERQQGVIDAVSERIAPGRSWFSPRLRSAARSCAGAVLSR